MISHYVILQNDAFSGVLPRLYAIFLFLPYPFILFSPPSLRTFPPGCPPHYYSFLHDIYPCSISPGASSYFRALGILLFLAFQCTRSVAISWNKLGREDIFQRCWASAGRWSSTMPRTRACSASTTTDKSRFFPKGPAQIQISGVSW